MLMSWRILCLDYLIAGFVAMLILLFLQSFIVTADEDVREAEIGDERPIWSRNLLLLFRRIRQTIDKQKLSYSRGKEEGKQWAWGQRACSSPKT